MKSNKIRIAIADDHSIYRTGIKLLLEDDAYEIVGEASNGTELMEMAVKTSFDVLIIDYKMPKFEFFTAIPKLRSLSFSFKIILLSGNIEKYIFQKCMNFNLDGILLKEDPFIDIVKVIETILAGGKYITSMLYGFMNERNPIQSLTPTEMNVLKLIASGHKLKDIADILDIRLNTVDVHKRNIKKKLNVSSNADLMKVALENNLL